jgi:hypothetical protein
MVEQSQKDDPLIGYMGGGAMGGNVVVAPINFFQVASLGDFEREDLLDYPGHSHGLAQTVSTPLHQEMNINARSQADHDRI